MKETKLLIWSRFVPIYEKSSFNRNFVVARVQNGARLPKTRLTLTL